MNVRELGTAEVTRTGGTVGKRGRVGDGRIANGAQAWPSCIRRGALAILHAEADLLLLIGDRIQESLVCANGLLQQSRFALQSPSWEQLPVPRRQHVRCAEAARCLQLHEVRILAE